MPNVPYSYEVNGKLVTGNGSLIPISSLSNRSLLPSLTVPTSDNFFCGRVSILIFSKKCHYLQNKVGVVNFTKTHELVKFQSLRSLRDLGFLQNLLLPLYFGRNVSLSPRFRRSYPFEVKESFLVRLLLLLQSSQDITTYSDFIRKCVKNPMTIRLND